MNENSVLCDKSEIIYKGVKHTILLPQFKVNKVGYDTDEIEQNESNEIEAVDFSCCLPFIREDEKGNREVEVVEIDAEDEIPIELKRHLFLLRSNGKYCLLNTNFDCIFVVEPFTKAHGFMVSSKLFTSTVEKYYKKYSQYDMMKTETKTKLYEELAEKMYYTITFNEWKQMTKPKPIRGIY